MTHIDGPHRRAGLCPKTSCATQTGLRGERGKIINLKDVERVVIAGIGRVDMFKIHMKFF